MPNVLEALSTYGRFEYQPIAVQRLREVTSHIGLEPEIDERLRDLLESVAAEIEVSTGPWPRIAVSPWLRDALHMGPTLENAGIQITTQSIQLATFLYGCNIFKACKNWAENSLRPNTFGWDEITIYVGDRRKAEAVWDGDMNALQANFKTFAADFVATNLEATQEVLGIQSDLARLLLTVKLALWRTRVDVIHERTRPSDLLENFEEILNI